MCVVQMVWCDIALYHESGCNGTARDLIVSPLLAMFVHASMWSTSNQSATVSSQTSLASPDFIKYIFTSFLAIHFACSCTIGQDLERFLALVFTYHFHNDPLLCSSFVSFPTLKHACNLTTGLFFWTVLVIYHTFEFS